MNREMNVRLRRETLHVSPGDRHSESFNYYFCVCFRNILTVCFTLESNDWSTSVSTILVSVKMTTLTHSIDDIDTRNGVVLRYNIQQVELGKMQITRKMKSRMSFLSYHKSWVWPKSYTCRNKLFVIVIDIRQFLSLHLPCQTQTVRVGVSYRDSKSILSPSPRPFSNVFPVRL
jgi:hypothetical protein